MIISFRAPAVERLDQLVRIRTGGTPSRSDPRGWTNGSIPWVTTSEVDGGRIRKTNQFITEHGLANSSAFVVPAGSVLVAMIGQGKTRGQTSLLQIDAATNQNCAALLPGERVQPAFLHHYLSYAYKTLRSLSNSSGQGNLNAKLIGSFPVPVPPLPEQRKIAKILGAWDDAIEKLLLIRSGHERRRGWIRSFVLTGKSRLSGFSDNWVRAPLASVLREHGGKSTGSEEVYSVSVHRGLVNQIEHLGRSYASANTDRYNRVLPGDVVYTKSPTGDFPLGIVKQSRAREAVLVSPLYGVFTPTTPELGAILHTLFESPIVTANYLGPLVQKGAKNTIAITNRHFLMGPIDLPASPSEQKEIARVLTASEEELALIDRQIALLREQKRGLMQKLLTGDIRVTVDPTEEAQP